MGRVTVAWENRNTLDGRLIELNALKPRSSRLPIFYNFSYTTALGWAEDFGRWLNPETGWGELSFELYFSEKWEAKLRENHMLPTIGMSGIPTLPVDPEGKRIITAGEITCVSFGIGLNAWGEAVNW